MFLFASGGVVAHTPSAGMRTGRMGVSDHPVRSFQSRTPLLYQEGNFARRHYFPFEYSDRLLVSRRIPLLRKGGVTALSRNGPIPLTTQTGWLFQATDYPNSFGMSKW